MKSNVNPVVAAVVIVLMLAVAGVLIYTRMAGTGPQYGAEIPDVVKQDAIKNGPRPMPPVPMPNGGSMAVPGGGAGAPPAGAGGR
jgi:hypothetical protein